MKATWILVVSAAIASGVFTGSTLRGQSASPAAGEFEQDVLPVLSRSCIRCHNDRLQTGKLSLEGFRDGASARQRADVWQKVLDKITTALPDALVVVAKIIPFTNATQYNAMIPGVVSSRVAQGKHIIIVDCNTNFPAGGMDFVHPYQSGYNWMGDRFYESVSSLLPK